jgi:hypothetical protein
VHDPACVDTARSQEWRPSSEHAGARCAHEQVTPLRCRRRRRSPRTWDLPASISLRPPVTCAATCGGMVRPSVWAAVRLTSKSNSSGCSIGHIGRFGAAQEPVYLCGRTLHQGNRLRAVRNQAAGGYEISVRVYRRSAARGREVHDNVALRVERAGGDIAAPAPTVPVPSSTPMRRRHFHLNSWRCPISWCQPSIHQIATRRGRHSNSYETSSSGRQRWGGASAPD